MANASNGLPALRLWRFCPSAWEHYGHTQTLLWDAGGNRIGCLSTTRSSGLAAVCHPNTCAASADDCFDVFEEVREGKRIGGDIRLPKLKNWLALYHRREKVIRGVLSALKESNDELGEMIKFYEDALKGLKID